MKLPPEVAADWFAHNWKTLCQQPDEAALDTMHVSGVLLAVGSSTDCA